MPSSPAPAGSQTSIGPELSAVSELPAPTSPLPAGNSRCHRQSSGLNGPCRSPASSLRSLSPMGGNPQVQAQQANAPPRSLVSSNIIVPARRKGRASVPARPQACKANESGEAPDAAAALDSSLDLSQLTLGQASAVP